MSRQTSSYFQNRPHWDKPRQDYNYRRNPGGPYGDARQYRRNLNNGFGSPGERQQFQDPELALFPQQPRATDDFVPFPDAPPLEEPLGPPKEPFMPFNEDSQLNPAGRRSRRPPRRSRRPYYSDGHSPYDNPYGAIPRDPHLDSPEDDKGHHHHYSHPGPSHSHLEAPHSHYSTQLDLGNRDQDFTRYDLSKNDKEKEYFGGPENYSPSPQDYSSGPQDYLDSPQIHPYGLPRYPQVPRYQQASRHRRPQQRLRSRRRFRGPRYDYIPPKGKNDARGPAQGRLNLGNHNRPGLGWYRQSRWSRGITNGKSNVDDVQDVLGMVEKKKTKETLPAVPKSLAGNQVSTCPGKCQVRFPQFLSNSLHFQPDLDKHDLVTEAPQGKKRWIDTGFIHKQHGTFIEQVLTEFK